VGAELGVEEVFWRIAMRPGKPLWFGVRGGTLVFGLPGNPVSSLVCFELFVRPALLALQGHRSPAPPFEPGTLGAAVRRNPADGDAHFVLSAVLSATGAAGEARRERELAVQLSSKYEEWERRPNAAAEPVPRGHPRYPIHRAFEAALISRVRSGRWPPEAEDLMQAMEVVSAPYYRVDAEEIWTHSRGIDHVPGAKVPLLVLHPEDDGIIKVEHARMLQQAANGNDLVRVWILPAGSHGLLEAADPRWTHAVYRTFFERWATYAERTTPQANGRSADLVYSSQQPG
jgi:pimeloyl-ACP methyl ester carboxylesterase